MKHFHPDLYPAAYFLPKSVPPRLIAALTKLQDQRGRAPETPNIDGVKVDDVVVTGKTDGHPIRARLYRPENAGHSVPALLWIHGGGFVAGDYTADQINNVSMVLELGIAVLAVNYRLSPKHPFPAPIDDCYSALQWLHTSAASLGILADRLAIGGSSAGAGLAAGLTSMAYDRKEIPLSYQLLIYPMLDDRTVLRTDVDRAKLRLWDNGANRYGWTSYLNQNPGDPNVSPYAAPARRLDVSGLPPAWIGVGTCDLFHDEDVAYAQRLTSSGVACELCVVEGAYHGFDYVSRSAPVVRDFRQKYFDALRRGLRAPY